MPVRFSDDFDDRLKEVGADLANEKWDDFCRRMVGKPDDEIRAAIAREWDGEISDEGVRALSSGEPIPLNIKFKP